MADGRPNASLILQSMALSQIPAFTADTWTVLFDIKLINDFKDSIHLKMFAAK